MALNGRLSEPGDDAVRLSWPTIAEFSLHKPSFA
jgi:hypothetical protein